MNYIAVLIMHRFNCFDAENGSSSQRTSELHAFFFEARQVHG